MVCPRCAAAVPVTAAFCPSCGAPLAPPAVGEGAVPLTAEQQQSLRVMLSMPTMIGGVVLVGFCLIGSCITLTWRGNAVVPWIAGTILVVVVGGMLAAIGLHVRNVRADLRSGVAQVRVDRLVRTRRVRSGGQSVSYSYYGVFERGEIVISKEHYEQLNPGGMYRVVFSPKVNRAWTIEPVAGI